MKNKRIVVLSVIGVALLSVVVIVAIKNNSSNQTKEDELIYDDNGNAYRSVKTGGYEIDVNVNQKNIVEEKPLFDSNSININHYNTWWQNESGFYMDTMYEMPDFFDVENVKKITYTLQNATGRFIINNERINSRGAFDNYKGIETVDNKPIIWKPQNFEYLYMQIYINTSQDKNSELYEANKEQLEKAIIKADIEYINGNKQTQYIGMKVSSPYNCNSLYFSELVME